MSCSPSDPTRPVASLFRSVFRHLAVAFCSVALLADLGAQTQTVQTGTIRGKIQNATNGANLENVAVAIDGTTHHVLTNSYGEYVITGAPAGQVTLHATYVGEPDQTAAVTVNPGAETTHDFVFRQEAAKHNQDGTLVLDPFTVNAERYRNAQAIATAEERVSVNIKNVVSTDQFGYIPSGNVGEFVKFLPGVQLDYGASNGNNQGYSENTANGVSVRGFGPEDTAILIDGLPVASTIPGNLTRQVGLDQMSINNASRVELIKVATPDMPANSAGGQVNLITRNAFEYAHPTYSARLFFNFSSLDHNLGKSPGPTHKDTYKTTPAFDFNASYPISKTLGISFSGAWTNEFNRNYRGQLVWNNTQASNYRSGAFTNAAGEKSSISNPILTRYQVTESGDTVNRKSGNIRVDWKPTPTQLLRANVQYSTYDTAEAQRKLDFRPTIAAGADWDDTKVIGTTANSTTAMTVTTRDRTGDTLSGQLQYDLELFGFKLSAAGSISKSKSDFEDEDNGHFSEIALNLNPGYVALFQLNDGLAGNVVTRKRTTNLPLDYTTLSNWAFDGTTAKSGQSHNEHTIGLYKVDLERPLDFLPFLGTNTLSVKTGWRHDEDKNLKSGRGSNYRQILKPSTSYTVGDILDDNYLGQSPGFGLAPQQWASTYKLYELNQSKDIFYVPDIDESTNTRVENYNSYVGQQKDLKETIDGVYGMLTGNFFNDRFSFVAGARQESKSRVGHSPFTDPKWDYVRNKDGSLYADAANPNGVQFSAGNGSVLNGVLVTAPTNRPLFANTPAGIALRQNLTNAGVSFPAIPYGPTTGNNASLASRMLQYQPFHAVNQHVSGKPSFSLAGVYRITKKIDVKASYSRAFKLQNLESGAAGGVISGTSNFTVEEYTDSQEQSNNGALGQIQVANPGLKPETVDAVDLEASYFTDNGGKFTVSYWVKDVTDQVMNFVNYSGTPTFDAVLGAIGLDPESFEDWKVVTSTNSLTKQRTSGWEFEVRQDLGFLGNWGRRISGFASFSMNTLGDPQLAAPYVIEAPDGTMITQTPTVATITKRANRFGGAGLQYAGNRFVAQIRGVYRNENEVPNSTAILAENNNIIRQMQPAETRIDINLSYLLTKHFSLFLSGRDVFNGERDEVYEDDQGLIPKNRNLVSRKKFGASWTAGVSGTW